MIIRPATLDDLDILTQLEVDYASEMASIVPHEFHELEYPLPRNDIERMLSDASWRVFLAEIKGTAVGYLSCKVSRGDSVSDDCVTEGKLCDLYVVNKCRAKGVASALRCTALAWFGEMDCVWETLTVHASNEAIRIYDRWGFKSYSVNMRRRLP